MKRVAQLWCLAVTLAMVYCGANEFGAWSARAPHGLVAVLWWLVALEYAADNFGAPRRRR